jgi:diguanylate cyclase (GGDEF)-like protein/PAS domain S-box-containing protein
VAKTVSEEEKLLEFLYAAPTGLVEIDASGTIGMINPYAMKHLMPLAGVRDAGNLFAMLESSAPELRNLFDSFAAERGTVCDGHRIVVDIRRHRDGTQPKVLACTLVKLDADRAIACISDITLQVAQERRLKQAETWFSSLMNDINDYAVVSITSEGVVDAVNTSWTKQTGQAGDGLIGQTLADIFPPVDDDTLDLVELLRITARDGWYLDEMWHARSDGSRYWCQRLLAARAGSDGQLAGYTVVLRDIARPAYDTDDLRRLLTQDHLTGAANRARFQHLFERAHLAWTEHGTPLSLIMLDIDHFKRVNDSYGHLTGDLVLVDFADAIAAAIRPSDVFARLGGEEFAVLLTGTTLSEASDMAERLRVLIAGRRVSTPQGDLSITVSLGCATATPHDDLLRSADAALYIAKQNGRNRVHTAASAAAAA